MASNTVEGLWKAGFAVGDNPDADCKMCGHRWGPHLLHPIDDDNPMAGGTLSCPDEGSCNCSGTWSLPMVNKVCDFGRKLVHKTIKGICPRESTVTLMIVDDSTEEVVEIHLCSEHAQQVPGVEVPP